jgi:hypothetical protein
MINNKKLILVFFKTPVYGNTTKWYGFPLSSEAIVKLMDNSVQISKPLN